MTFRGQIGAEVEAAVRRHFNPADPAFSIQSIVKAVMHGPHMKRAIAALEERDAQTP